MKIFHLFRVINSVAPNTTAGQRPKTDAVLCRHINRGHHGDTFCGKYAFERVCWQAGSPRCDCTWAAIIGLFQGMCAIPPPPYPRIFQGQVEQATRARIADEQGVLNDCDARAATLKSEAAVRALKVKRGARRGLRRTSPSVPQPTTSLDVTEQVSKLLGSAAKQNHAEQVAQETNRCTAVLAGSGGLYHGTNKIGETASRSHGTDGPVGGEEDDNAVSLAARAAQNAERAEDLARGLRRGLKLRDEVVASVNARDFCRGAR